MYSNEPPRPGGQRREGAPTDAFRPERPGGGPSRPEGSRADLGPSRTEPGQSRAEAGRASRAGDGRVNRDVDLDDVSPRSRSASGGNGRGAAGSGGNGHGRAKPASSAGNSGRGLLIFGGTAGVIVLALIAYFATKPSGNSDPSGASAGATSSSQVSAMPPAPSSAAAKPTTSAAASASASASASGSGVVNSPVPSNTVAVDFAQVHVQVFNASGVNLRATGLKNALVTDGFALATVGGTLAKAPTTTLYYPATRTDSADAVARALGIPGNELSQSSTYTEVTVVIGQDWPSGNTYPAG